MYGNYGYYVILSQVNLQRQPYIMQLLLFSGPAKTVNTKAKLTNRVYDPESSGDIIHLKVDHVIHNTLDDHLKFVQLLFDLKPSCASTETVNKV